MNMEKRVYSTINEGIVKFTAYFCGGTYDDEKSKKIFEEYLNLDTEKELEEWEKVQKDKVKKLENTIKEELGVVYEWIMLFQDLNEYKRLINADKMKENTWNTWKDDIRNDSIKTISNDVYKFSTDIYKYEKWDRTQNALITDHYEATWRFYIRKPSEDSYVEIDGQYGKKYKTLEEAEKYLQGRFKKYEKYFREQNPIVPAEYADNFKYKGIPFPGYRIEGEE